MSTGRRELATFVPEGVACKTACWDTCCFVQLAHTAAISKTLIRKLKGIQGSILKRSPSLSVFSVARSLLVSTCLTKPVLRRLDPLKRTEGSEMRSFNPATALTSKISRLKNSRTHLQLYIFPSFNKPLSILCGLIGVLSHANAKKRKRKCLRMSNFTLLLLVFRVISWQ